jgi:myo-inositol 2-dehydrogenase/D-chiro-inositol 1-dehydrogenase
MAIRIGVIGTGIMGADHVETVTTAIPGAEVCCIADIDARRAEVIASGFRAHRRYRRLKGLSSRLRWTA